MQSNIQSLNQFHDGSYSYVLIFPAFCLFKVQSYECIKCGANTTSNKERTDCIINACQFSPAAGVLYDLMPMANVGGPMVEVKQYPDSQIWYRNYYYVNLCTRDHDNSSCTDLRQKADESGKFVRKTVSLRVS